jgi:hypothetical protein
MSTINFKRSVGALAVAAGLLAATAPADARETSRTPQNVTVGVTPQGLIMKDGNICDPIRHIGC